MNLSFGQCEGNIDMSESECCLSKNLTFKAFVGVMVYISLGGGGAGKNFEMNKFLKNGDKNIRTQGPCICYITKNVKKIVSCRLDVK